MNNKAWSNTNFYSIYCRIFQIGNIGDDGFNLSCWDIFTFPSKCISYPIFEIDPPKLVHYKNITRPKTHISFLPNIVQNLLSRSGFVGVSMKVPYRMISNNLTNPFTWLSWSTPYTKTIFIANLLSCFFINFD